MLGALEKQASILLKTSLPVVNNRALKKRAWRRTGLEMFARLLFAQFCFLVRHDLTDLLRLRIAVGIGLRLVHSRRRHSCEHDSTLLTRLLALLCCVALPCRNAALRFSGSGRAGVPTPPLASHDPKSCAPRQKPCAGTASGPRPGCKHRSASCCRPCLPPPLPHPRWARRHGCQGANAHARQARMEGRCLLTARQRTTSLRATQ